MIIPAISILIAGGSLILTQQRASKKEVSESFTQIKKDAVDMEHRLTDIENNKFTQADRKCLQEMDVKMGLLWEAIKEDFPGLLKRFNTPRYDELLNKAHKSIKALSTDDANNLIRLLKAEVELAKRTENTKQIERATIASLYSAVVKYESQKGALPHGCK